jgi:DNA (cytosine-5)-methyltransferase 1
MRTLNMAKADRPSMGSLFAGIGGFDVGFEKAGFKTAWQVEIDPTCRAVLCDRFPEAIQLEDVNKAGAHNLPQVDVICGGFPCQDVSSMGKRKGLSGARTGLFWQVVRILSELRPQWVVLENVVGLLSSNDGADFSTVIKALADIGYVGLWRVLDSSGFGVPQSRRRVFIVGGLGCQPPIELLSDASPVERLPRSSAPVRQSQEADGYAAYCLLAHSAPSQIGIGCENLIATEGCRHKMVERARMSKDAGLCLGLDEANFAEVRAAGNAVTVTVAEWVARKLFQVTLSSAKTRAN